MTQKRLILDSKLLQITIDRLCQQLIENHGDFSNSVILGLQPRGIFLAERITKRLKALSGIEVNLGYLDVTFYRDDFRRRETPLVASETKVSFIIENKKVILVDDVLFTGRTVRSAMDAMNAFGRPSKVELLALIDRKYSRDLPIEPNYVGRHVNTMPSQKILAEWTEQGAIQDQIWLITND